VFAPGFPSGEVRRDAFYSDCRGGCQHTFACGVSHPTFGVTGPSKLAARWGYSRVTCEVQLE
jgi:hypothetical protein